MFAKSKIRLLAATVAFPVVFIAGCGGGSNNAIPAPTIAFTPAPGATASPGATATPTSAPPAATNVGSFNVIGLTSNNTLVRFNTQAPGNVTPVAFSGLTGGEALIGIDFRFAPSSGTPGLYGLARRTATTYQLVRIDLSAGGNTAVATDIGTAFSANLTSIGFDFNPQVVNGTVRTDLIRVVSANGTNLRLDPNTGALVDTDANQAGTQVDTNTAFAAGDVNQGTMPRLVGSAYTNNDSDINTGTALFNIDAATNSLVLQGSSTVSPNGGQLTTVGRLGVVVESENVGFDIAPNGNAAFATIVSSGTTRLYSINLGNGQVSTVGNVGLAGGAQLVGLAIVP